MSDPTTELLRRHARQLEWELEQIRDTIRYGAPDRAQHTVTRIHALVAEALTQAYARHNEVGL